VPTKKSVPKIKPEGEVPAYAVDETIITLTSQSRGPAVAEGIQRWRPGTLIEQSRVGGDVRVSVQVAEAMTVEIDGLSSATVGGRSPSRRSWMQVELIFDGDVIDSAFKRGPFGTWEEAVSTVRALVPGRTYDIWIHQKNRLCTVYASWVRVRVP
jgi:hypothetical protein